MKRNSFFNEVKKKEKLDLMKDEKQLDKHVKNALVLASSAILLSAGINILNN